MEINCSLVIYPHTSQSCYDLPWVKYWSPKWRALNIVYPIHVINMQEETLLRRGIFLVALHDRFTPRNYETENIVWTILWTTSYQLRWQQCITTRFLKTGRWIENFEMASNPPSYRIPIGGRMIETEQKADTATIAAIGENTSAGGGHWCLLHLKMSSFQSTYRWPPRYAMAMRLWGINF